MMLTWKIQSFVKLIWSWIGVKECDVLRRIIDDNNFKSFAEIGVWEGKISRYLLRKCRLDRVVCVDNYPSNNYMGDKEKVDKARLMAKELCSNPKVTFLEMDSVEASKAVKDESLDMAYIDADHSYESVKGDIEAWFRKVRKGGIICGHDYCIHKFGVIKAVSEKFDWVKLYPDYVWAYRK